MEAVCPQTGWRWPGWRGFELLDMEGCPWWALLHGKAGHGQRVPNGDSLQNSLTLSSSPILNKNNTERKA